MPADLRAFYREHDGGCPEKSRITLGDGNLMRFHQFMRIANGELERAYIGARVDPGFLPDDLIPFGIDEGGDYFCVAMPSQAVVHFVTDDADDPEAATTYVSASLAELVEQMT